MTTIPARISALLTRDYADEVTERHCHQLARWANRFHPSLDGARLLVESAEHMAALTEQVRRGQREGKVEVLRRELERSVR